MNISYLRAVGGSVFVLLTSMLIVFAVNCVSADAQTGKKEVVTRKVPPKTTTSVVGPVLPKVTQIDNVALLNLVKRDSSSNRPLVVNFWATWCGPCVEEFPELVKFDQDYTGKIDFITISMDELTDINTEVPKFLARMNAKMPAYLLITDDEEAAINSITNDWQGGLPFTIIYDSKGGIFYSKQGKIKPVEVRAEIDKLTKN